MKYTSIIVAVGLALAAALASAPAQAQLTRTFVSPTGSDSNNCSLAAPCRHFQAALAQTTPGGEIAVLGTAGYNGGATFTIDRAVSIVNPGAFEAGIVPPAGGIGIMVNAGASDAISLRGLTIEGGGVGNYGIIFNTGQSLTIQNCVIRHLGYDGIDFLPNASSNLSVSNTLVADNGNHGIFVYPVGSGTVTAVINRVEANNNSLGIYVDGSNSTGTVNATVSDSVAAGSTWGFYAAESAGHAPTTLTVVRSLAANNGSGLYASGATIRVANSTVTGNTNGWVTAGSGVVKSYGDNYIDGNGDGDPTPPSIVRK